MIRVPLVVLTLLALTLVLLPFQLIGIMFDNRLQRIVPHLFHRAVCAIIGIRIHQVGQCGTDRPMLILSNHVSWLDIIVVTAVTPVVFVAKHEVASWPLFGWLAKLQRTIFIERERRQKTGAVAREMGDRLTGGDTVVLFAEGTSSDGNRILPFRSALIGSVHHALGSSTHHSSITVQPLSLAYVGFGGVPAGRALRNKLAWYGDVDLIPHMLDVLRAGAVDVTVSWGAAVAYDMSTDRKQIAREAERSVRRMNAAALRYPPGRQSAPAPETADPVPGVA
ncbi:lysophospholipid acyltransferase family protein [Bradyrhizobium sp. 2TAF24]|uniref:lysophospholipid acyltransferase family protein n=1 Tax=Bradyrhizobium sp. 2TAF24 TaxID=3233011 RepID=UPI003F90B1D3